LKKLLVIFLVLASVILMSNFASAGSIKPQTTIASDGSLVNSQSPIDIMAPLPLFPTNATFETKAEVIGNASFSALGGSYADYFAQSFKALSDYIVNGGIWLEQYSTPVPTLRLMLCNNTSGYPDIASPIAYSSQNITGAEIQARPGRFYLNLTQPIRVQQNRTYWLVVDGHMDSVSAGSAKSKRLAGNPYKDGILTFSNDAGNTWENSAYPTWDFDFVITFSNRPNKAEVFGTVSTHSVGGSSGSDYYAQSFKALDSYIIDAGIWIENYTEPTPNFRVQIWGNNATGFNHPNNETIIASSRVIKGSEINSTQGQRYFVHPNVSISVTVGEIYWLVIDGYYDQTTAGRAGSRGTTEDVYTDGEFLYSNNAGSTWNTFSTADLNFIVTFSASRSAIKLMKGGSTWSGIGGNGINNYAAQSFKALNKYILDAGIWLQNNGINCPDTRLLICPASILNASEPDLTSPLSRSIPITGQQISNNPGMQYLKPTKPIEVVPGQTYFFIVDGYSIGNATAGNLLTYDHYWFNYQPPHDPYTDGMEMYSRNGGVTWGQYTFYDLGVDITFSDVPYEAQCGSTGTAPECGWQALTPYFAQSFVALNDFIADAGIWIGPESGTTPNFRLLLVGNNATSYNHPDMTNILASSMRILGTDINATSGMYYIKPPTPILVERLQRYWIVIDGSYDKVTVGTAASRSVNYDAYPDGQFLWAYQNLDLGWHPDTGNHRYDLQFDVIFTHVNQPPTQPDVSISPLKPFDSDDLTAQWPIPSIDLEMEPIAYYVEWYQNGVPQPAWANNIVLPNSATSPTDNWMAKVTPYDGHINGTAGMYTVHVLADILTLDHLVTAESQPFHVITKSNTTITDFAFNHTGSIARLNFTSTGPSGTIGFCNITIPNNLMHGSPWVITVNGYLVDPPKTDNGTHTTIALEYLFASSVSVMIQGDYIVPEFTPAMLLITLGTITLAVAVVNKKINKKKQ